MDSRRLTVFPRTGTDWDNTSFIRRKDGAPPHRAPKAKTHSDQGPADPKLPKVSKIKLPARVKHKIFTPIDGDPGQYYRCIHIVDPEGERPYCLAQDTTSDATEHAYRVVMIRRGPDRSVVGLDKPNPNLLNIVSVFRFEGSLFTVFDRPGLALSEIAVSHSPQLGLAEVKTISAEALSGICALSAAGLYLSSVELEDITVSAIDGQVKVAFDRASLQETTEKDNASAFGSMLQDLMSRVSSPSKLHQSDDLHAFIRHATQATYAELQNNSFLKDALPTPSLIPSVLNAQIIVLPVDHVAETRITELAMS